MDFKSMHKSIAKDVLQKSIDPLMSNLYEEEDEE
jgi:hypothetical protein